MCACRNVNADTDAAGMTAHVAQEDGDLSYWLYTPQNARAGMPLIVYLHGGSGKGGDLDLILEADSLPKYLWQGSAAPQAYVLIPQLPEKCRGWAEKTEQVLRLVSQITTAYSIDSSRVSLTGHSMGGTGVWQLATASPETFCSIAPLSGSVQTTDTAVQALRGLSVWAVVGAADKIVPPESSLQMVQALTDAGGSVCITVLDDTDHFGVPAFYLDTEAGLLEWLA